MATKTSSARGKKKSGGHGRNYLIVGKGGTLLLASGSTGKIRPLTRAESEAVLPLLKQRQQLGGQLAKVLQKKGFPLAPDIIWDLEI